MAAFAWLLAVKGGLLLLLLPATQAFPSENQIIPDEPYMGLITNLTRRSLIRELDQKFDNSSKTAPGLNEAQLELPGVAFLVSVRTTDLDVFIMTSNNTLNLTFQLTSLAIDQPGLAISFDCDNDLIAQIQKHPWFVFGRKDLNLNRTLSVQFDAFEMGKVFMRVWARRLKTLPSASDRERVFFLEDSPELYWDAVLTEDIDQVSKPQFGWKLAIQRRMQWQQMAFRVIITLLVVFITFAMGCGLDPKIILQILKRPIGPVIGFLCQYCIMPSLAFCLGYFIPLMPELSLGLFIIGCCPGGGASNIWSFLLGGDINLSMTMTFISTMAALFMMPLLINLLGGYFMDTQIVRIPYENIIINLVMILVPCLLGMLVCWKKPEWAKKIIRKTKLLGAFFLIFILSFGIWANIDIYRVIAVYRIVIPICAMLPWLGFLISSFCAWILRQPRSFIITIGIETMMQNIGIAMLILLYSMPKPDGEIGSSMPLIVAIFTPFPLYIALLVKTIHSRCCKTKKEIEIDSSQVKDSCLDSDQQTYFLDNRPVKNISRI